MNRYPYHRYLRYLVLEGDGVDEIVAHVKSLGYVAPSVADVTHLRRTLFEGRVIDDKWRETCDVAFLDEDGDDLRMAHWFVQTPVVRQVLEQALFERVSCRHCAQIVSLKFGVKAAEGAVALFRRGWWDTEGLTVLDFSTYWRMAGERKPDPQPVPLHMRAAAAAWEQGILPDEEEMSTDDIIRTLQVEAFMAFKAAKAVASPESQNEARKWAATALRASQIRKPRPPPGKGPVPGQPELPDLKPAVYFPDHTPPSLAQLAAIDAPGDDDDPI